jgi:hypothetical protein
MAAQRTLYWLVIFPLVVGCGDGLSSVTGTVTLDGKPIEGGPLMYGTVSFYRSGGGGAPAVGVIDESGRYSLKTGAREGIEPGKYDVGIAVKKVTLPTTAEGMPQPHLVTPEKYASTRDSGLRADVKPGNNTCDFALSSQPN